MRQMNGTRHFRAMVVMVSAVLGLALTTSAGALTLGPAADFNVYVFGSATLMNTDVEGRLAVGGAGSFTNFGAGDKLTAADDGDDNVIISGSLAWTNGQVFHGNLVTGAPPALTSVGIPNGTARVESDVVDFVGDQTILTSLADQYAGYTATGVTDVTPWNAITLTGGDGDLNIFDLAAGDLGAAVSLDIHVPAGSRVLINVDGTTASMQNFGIFLNGATNHDVLWNFHEAQSLTMGGIGIRGSILAPRAGVTFNNGQMEGTLVAATLFGTGEYHHVPFNGIQEDPPPPDDNQQPDAATTPEPATAGMLALTLLGVVGYTRRRSR